MTEGDGAAIEAFERYLLGERGYSPHTARAYLGEVRRLAGSEECLRDGGLDRIEPLALRAYLARFHRSAKATTRTEPARSRPLRRARASAPMSSTGSSPDSTMSWKRKR